MDTSFRPGPWRLGLPDETMVVDRNGTEVAAIQGDYDVDWERMFGITNMIAAAPEMYEALKEAQRAIREYRCQGAPTAFWDDVESANCAALAKAEGK